MGLVDYSSSSSSDADADTDADGHHRHVRHGASSSSLPPAKRQKKTSAAGHARAETKPTATNTTTQDEESLPPALPPLPASFHDLYAAAVRPAPADLPSLHQGRRRAVPHVPGNWPSHLYVEWRPPPAQHRLLVALLDALADELSSSSTAATITSLLTSDLAAPLPLHISLSRPFALRTPERDPFHAALARALLARAGAGQQSGAPFALRADGLAWFRSPDAARSFLVLRVRSAASSSSITTATATAATTTNATSTDPSTANGDDHGRAGRRNPELAALLARCNACVGAVGQPVLYAPPRRRRRRRLSTDDGGAQDDETGSGSRSGSGAANTLDGTVGEERRADDDDAEGAVVDEEAFHVSIAWSFAEPTEDVRARTAAVFARDEFRRGLVDAIRIPVDGVKVKIGNVVTTIPLGGAAGSGTAGRRKVGGLFGI